MRVAKSLVMLLMLCLATSAMAGQLSPGFESYLLQKADGPVDALLVLEDQVDVVGMDLDLHFQRTTLADRHFRVVTALQEKAAETQGPLLAEIEARLGNGVDSYKSYWLINAVFITASEDALRDLVAHESVKTAEVNVGIELIEPQVTPVQGKGERGVGIAPGIVAVGARRVWDELGIRGEGALIGSLDTGVDGDHPALANRYRGLHAPASECWLDVLGNGTTFPVDNHGHGTHTTGTMAGVAYDDSIGIAPAAEWIAANAIDQSANSGFVQDIIDCLEFFTDPDGDPGTLDDVPDVVQNSWGVNENFDGFVDCDNSWWAAIDACEAAGVALCWSAGNEGPSSQTLRSPGDRATTLYNCFSVGSTQYYSPYEISSFSSRGPAGPNCGPTENRTKPEISAPGSDIYSAAPGGGYQNMSGTSMAGPHVAGVFALLRSANPNVDVITMKQVLMETANDLGQVGDDNTYGNGFLDAYEAVQAVMGGLGYVEGVVEDRDSGLPIEGAVLGVVDGYQSFTTGADGTFRLTLPVGQATITAEAFGYADLQQVVTVNEDATTYQDLSMQLLPVATVSGTVYEAGSVPGSATPAAGALVEVGNAPVDGVTADAYGQFSFDLPAGNEYVFGASMPGEGGISQTVLVDGDMDLPLYLSQLTQDGFETGSFNTMDWTFSGDASWFVQSSTVYQGSYAAESGNIGDTQDSILQVAVDCGAGGEVSFAYKVSSESGWDYLRFYVDGSQVVEWSGEVGWAEYTHTVTAGTHTFRWAYEKDWSVSDGSDCGWLDDVTFPGGATPVPVCVPGDQAITVTLDPGASTVVPLLVMNQGAVQLNATATTTGWASVNPGTFSVDAYDYQVVNVTFDATGQANGMHTQNLTLASNDPANPSLTVALTMNVTDDITAAEDAPRAFQLVGAVPNPFNPQTTIKYVLPAAGSVRLRLYDVQGRLIRTLVDGSRPAGQNQVQWDGRDNSGRAMASGTYFARLEQNAQTSVKSLVLVR